MNNEIQIIAKGKPLALGDDFSISIEDKNPLFNDSEMFSYPVQIPLEGNRDFVGNIDDPNSDVRATDIEHTPVRIVVNGIPFRSGTAVISESEELEDSLSFNVDASEISLDDLICDLKCRDIPIPEEDKDDLVIGEKIGDVHCSLDFKYKVTAVYRDGKKEDLVLKSKNKSHTKVDFNPQALGFSFPGKCVIEGEEEKQIAEAGGLKAYYGGMLVLVPKVDKSYINTSAEYGATDSAGRKAKYCNARVCYKHLDIDDEGKTSDSVIKPENSTGNYEDQYPWWVLDADRPQSGICFYVLYFLECLFKHLGVTYDLSAINFGDFRRLCFFTTHCKYDERAMLVGNTTVYTEDDDEVKNGIKKVGDIKTPWTKELDLVNRWLGSRGSACKLYLDYGGEKTFDQLAVSDENGNYTVIKTGDTLQEIRVELNTDVEKDIYNPFVSKKEFISNVDFSASLFEMTANSDNFPDESVSTILESLENQFGIKFYYDYERNHVTAYLLRSVYRDESAPILLNCQVDTVNKITEKITGVRVGYDEESDAYEQGENVKRKVKDYNTSYDYIEYPKDRTVIGSNYKEITDAVSAGNMKVYIDTVTGNKYRVKIDSDAKTLSEMNPVLFEVGQWKGVEIGDCSKKNEDYIVEMKSSFTPIEMSDVNFKKIRNSASGTETFVASSGQTVQATAIQTRREAVLAVAIDEEMEHEFVAQKISNPFDTNWINLYLTEELCLTESYDPSNTDDGNSPLQSMDWGNSICIMRGGGADADSELYDLNYDGFGNSKWRTLSAQYAMNSDSMDMYGVEYDYGIASGVDTDIKDEHFSLKPRAWVQPEWADAPLVVDDIYDSDNPNKIVRRIKSRGYFDTFLAEHAHFLLNRKYYAIHVKATAAVIADIPNHWRNRFRIGDYIGYIDKITYDMSVSDGIDNVVIYMFSI